MSENNNKVASPPDQAENGQQVGLQHAGRRQFLKTLTAGGAVAGIAAVTASQAMAAGTQAPTEKHVTEAKDGYRETDHIRTFYDTLR